MSDKLTVTPWNAKESPKLRIDLDFEDGETLSTLGFKARTFDYEGDPSFPVTVVDLTVDPEQVGNVRGWNGDEYELVAKAGLEAFQRASTELAAYRGTTVVTLDQLKELGRAIDDLDAGRPGHASARLHTLFDALTKED